MTAHDSQPPRSLRRRAESLLDTLESRAEGLALLDVQRLVQELRVHQAELAIQNEELEQSQRALQEARDRYSWLYDHAPVGYLTLDHLGMITQANLTFAGMVDTAMPGVLGRPFSDFLHPDDKAIFLTRLRPLFREPRGKVMELRLAGQGQAWTHVRLQANTPPPSQEPAEKPPERLLVTVDDISDAKRWEAEKYNHANLLDSLLQALPSPVFFKDRTGRYLGCNRAFEEITGKTNAQVIGRTVEQVWPNPYSDIYLSSDRELLASPGHQRYDSVLLDAQGQLRDVVFYKASFPDAAGQVAGIVGVVLDITERKRTEQELAWTAAVNSCLAELSQLLLTGSELEDVSQAVLQKAKELTGSRQGFVGYVDRATAQLIPHTLTGDMWQQCLIQDATELPEPMRGLCGWVRDHKMPYLSNQATAEEIVQAPGSWKGLRVERFLSVPVMVGDRLVGQITLANSLRDYTAQDRSAIERLAVLYGLAVLHTWGEWELVEAKQAAEAGNVAKSQFLATMSHEIRTPMNAIMGMAQLALENPSCPEQKEYLQVIESSAAHLMALLNDILDLSKVEAGGLELESKPMDLEASLGELVRAQALRGTPKQIEIDLSVDQHLPLLLGDPIRLRQVIINLVDNAIKFSPMGGRISVEVRSDRREPGRVGLLLRVSDNGPGIPRDKRDDVFKPFVQLDNGSSRRHGGTGLGLSICRRLVNAMGGSIWVEESPQRGAAFCLSLGLPLAPATAAPAPPHPAAPANPAPAPRRGLSVLLAEDNLVNQKIGVALLEKAGHRVQVAGDGNQALEEFRRGGFDIILMDIEMPGMDGLQATAAIREIEAQAGGHLPIVALTAHAMKGDRERFLAQGMDAYLSKPISREALGQAIAEAMGWSAEAEG